MNKDSNTDYIPLNNIDQSTSDEIIEVNEENDQELLIPKNNVAQIEVEEEDEDSSSKIDVVVNNNNTNNNTNNSSNENESTQNPFLPSTSTASTSTTNSLQKKIKKSFLSEFGFFRKAPKKATMIRPIDGVFSNLNEKPEVRSDALPTYTQVTGESDQDPLYGHEVAYCHFGDYYGELLIDSIPAGTWSGLILSAFFSSIFDLIGFIMTFFLSTSHGTRKGALVGLSLTFIKYGYYIVTGEGMEDGTPTDDELEYNGISGLYDYWWFGEWVGYVMIILASYLAYHSLSRFRRILKVKEYADKHPDQIPEISF
jgi:hypothetical protein